MYLAETAEQAFELLAFAIWRCDTSHVPEVRTLANTLAKWFDEILARFDTGASNGLTEGLIIWSGRGRVFDVADDRFGTCGGRVLGSASPGVHDVAGWVN